MSSGNAGSNVALSPPDNSANQPGRLRASAKPPSNSRWSGSIFNIQFSIFNPQSSILNRQFSILINNLADYVRFLQQTPTELEILFKDLLIPVTNFFRDPEAFELLKEKGLAKMLDNLPSDTTFRIWIPGCATGEEAYSRAMLLTEALENSKKHLSLQIFATDIDEDAIERARTAVYPESMSADVSEERLQRFFIKEDHFYKIKKSIRERVIFSDQNRVKDPPFSRLHLVSCRNLLIYMDQVLQKKILPLFHYTLNPDGILFLVPDK